MQKQQIQKIINDLTKRQKEVLELFLSGKSDQNISQELCIEQVTVRKNIQNICEAFGFTNDFSDERHQKRKLLYKLIQENMPELINQPYISSAPLEQANNFYLKRLSIETICCRAITNPGCLLRIQAPLKMGKTSLVAQLLYSQDIQSYRTVFLKLRDVTLDNLESLDHFLRWLCTAITIELLDEGYLDSVDQHWSKISANPKLKCKTYFEKYLLFENTPLVLILDDLDRLFPHEQVAEEFLGMLRSRHEDAKASKTWGLLRLVVTYAETYIQIDANRSPFNAGKEVRLSDLDAIQIEELARLYNLSLSSTQIAKLMQAIGGHPYLIQEALIAIAQEEITHEEIISAVSNPVRIKAFNEYLRHHWNKLRNQPELLKTLSKIVLSKEPVELCSEFDQDNLVKLNDLGLVNLSASGVTPRYELYRNYFKSQLKGG
ncbi:MAG: AAA-like domain-containing protein [Leptolyngbyaceae cyanobacterium bins.302]|nr:AAA-like domain-containing protein [Leptolyngbyaceae cyanobacterium bins.302]